MHCSQGKLIKDCRIHKPRLPFNNPVATTTAAITTITAGTAAKMEHKTIYESAAQSIQSAGLNARSINELTTQPN